MSRNQMVLHYIYYCPQFRDMSIEERNLFIDKVIDFKNKHKYMPEFWEIKS